jgi:hypothetical protein
VPFLLLFAVMCTPLPPCDLGVSPCASPTPTLKWDQVSTTHLSGYDIYEREPGGPWGLLARIPCEWNDLDMNGTEETRFCRGPDLDFVVQRYCDWCLPYTQHDFAVTAYDDLGNSSPSFSNSVSICFSPICTFPGPCN